MQRECMFLSLHENLHPKAYVYYRLAQVKAHRADVTTRERNVSAREQSLREKEQHLTALLNQKDHEIGSLQQMVSELQQSRQYSHQDVEGAVKQAVARREVELRVLVMKREEEVALAMGKREEEIMEAVRRREIEVCDAWVKREAEIRTEVEENFKMLEERVQWAEKREIELREEETRLEEMKAELEANMKKIEQNLAKGWFPSSLQLHINIDSHRPEREEPIGRSQEFA